MPKPETPPYLWGMNTITLAIVEDDPIVRESLQTFFSGNPQFMVLAVANSVENFLALLEADGQLQPAILLLDIQLPGMTGIHGIPNIRAYLPKLSIIMLTTFEDSERIFSALVAGACSYLSKQTSLVKIKEAVLTVHQGGSYMSPSVARKVVEHFAPKPKRESATLTERQLDIVQGIVDGLSYKMIAARLDLSIDTVRTHIMHIYRTLNINSKGELIKKSVGGEL
jgi:DNA-binding NarL/FixJ family response regulator